MSKSPTVGAFLVAQGQVLLEKAILSVAPHVSQVVVAIDQERGLPDVEARLDALGLPTLSHFRFNWSDDSAYGFNLAISRLSTDWGVQIDDDETFTGAEHLPRLAAEAGPRLGWYGFPRRHWRDFERTVEIPEFYPDYQYRLRRTSCRVVGRVHPANVPGWQQAHSSLVTIEHFNFAIRSPEDFRKLGDFYKRLAEMPPSDLKA